MKRMILMAMCIGLGISMFGCGQKSEPEEGVVASSVDDVVEDAEEGVKEDIEEEVEQVVVEESVNEDSVEEPVASNEIHPLQVVDYGYNLKKDTLTGDKAYVHYWAILYNPNKNVAARSPKIQIVIQNPDGAVLLNSQCTLPLKDVTEETQVSITNPGARAIAVDGAAVPKSTSFEITGITESEDMFSTTVNGMITNNSSIDLGMIKLSAIFLKEGKISYVDGTFINALNAGASTAFSINVLGGVPEHDDVKVFAQVWG